jgi:hypothetical protein
MEAFHKMEALVKILINPLVLEMLYNVRIPSVKMFSMGAFKMFSLSPSITVVILFVTNAVTSRKMYLIK